MRKNLTIAFLLAALAFIVSLVYNPIALDNGESTPQESASPIAESFSSVEIAGQVLRVDIADTAAKREQGLSGRAALPYGEGMLFVFPKSGVYSFWMKDMNFSIDIIWISDSGEVVDIRERATPESYPDVFTPRAEARYVLEVPAGFVSMHTVNVGDMVRL